MGFFVGWYSESRPLYSRVYVIRYFQVTVLLTHISDNFLHRGSVKFSHLYLPNFDENDKNA